MQKRTTKVVLGCKAPVKGKLRYLASVNVVSGRKNAIFPAKRRELVVKK